jgi:FixJ family two-component response regulator
MRWEMLLASCIAEFLQTGCAVPFIVLAELADEKAVADIIQPGACDCAEKSLRDGADLLRTIRCTLNLQVMQQKRNSAEDSLRKLSARFSNPPIHHDYEQ